MAPGSDFSYHITWVPTSRNGDADDNKEQQENTSGLKKSALLVDLYHAIIKFKYNYISKYLYIRYFIYIEKNFCAISVVMAE